MTTKKTTPKAAAPADNAFPLKLAGKDVTLTGTPAAMMAISRAFGGLMPASERMRQLDIYALGGIVAAGLGRTATAAAVEKVTQEVAASDLAEVMAACSGLLARMIAGPAKSGSEG